jgi:hypothetical protein
MATQGVLSVVRNGRVAVKVVCGSDGNNVPALARLIRAVPDMTPEEIYAHAQVMHLGSMGSLVVMTPDRAITNADGGVDELGPLYRETFDLPQFNPRWANGTAEYVEVVNL